jgi:integrase/recombinase XerD
MTKLITSYHGQLVLKNITDLPPHITFEQYKKLKISILLYYKDKWTQQRQQIIDRDILFITYLWETGGRVWDVCNIQWRSFDMFSKFLELLIHKRRDKQGNRIKIKMPLSQEIVNDTLLYLRKYNIKDDERIFPFTKQNAWDRVKKYADGINFPKIMKTWKKGKQVESTLHPHLFRHGLAIYLLSQGVSIPIIAARLGHTNQRVTMDFYLKITPEIQQNVLKDIPLR